MDFLKCIPEGKGLFMEKHVENLLEYETGIAKFRRHPVIPWGHDTG